MVSQRTTINDSLKDHAVSVEWDYQGTMAWLHEWAARFDEAFDLKVGAPAICVKSLKRCRAYGTYLNGHNGFGLEHEITVDIQHLQGDDPADVLDTLLHEMLHQWQRLWGEPGKWNYHNKQFRDKAASLGLLIDHRGRSLGVQSESPFVRLLTQHDVDVSSLPRPSELPVRPRHGGRSKMKKWSCACTNVRCAVALNARCLKCGQVFSEAPPSW